MALRSVRPEMAKSIDQTYRCFVLTTDTQDKAPKEGSLVFRNNDKRHYFGIEQLAVRPKDFDILHTSKEADMISRQ